MPTSHTVRFACLAALLLPAAAGPAAESTVRYERDVRPVLKQHCVRCHGQDGEVNGDVNLLAMRTADDFAGELDVLRDVIRAVDAGEMPPDSEPALPGPTRRQLAGRLQQILHDTVAARQTFAHTPLRRMNRFQYNNAVKDLFDLKVEVFPLPEKMVRDYGYFHPEKGKMSASVRAGSRPLGKSQLIEPRLAGVAPFPQDLRAEHGFDNRGDHLSLSPLLMEAFLKLSQSIVNSPDFNAKKCGVWNELFAPPAGDDNLEGEVPSRLRKFLTRAFRRPVDDSVLRRYSEHVLAQVRAGESFTESMKSAASAAICSPRFLYLYERAADGETAQRLDDYELASRLSFFLWGSIPDDKLLALAEEGTLRDPQVLRRQIDRMLDDPRLKRFCDSFPTQWLQMDRILSSVPDKGKFPEFYFGAYRVSMHMMLEPLLLFETVLIEDRPILDLIDSDFSYRSDMLEGWYEDGGKSPRQRAVGPMVLKRVELTDRRQGGVITNAAVMTMTSNATRTQPITRGAWIATVIFNNPPEPPPADVPPLPEDDEPAAQDLTLRQRLEVHRQRADCASCHAKIDPLGFALENYGPTGRWRDNYENGLPVDAGGSLFREHRFDDVVQFKDAILAEKDRFTRGFATHLLSFALAREIDAKDAPALDRIVRETADEGYRFRPLLEQIILSEPFLHKNVRRTP